MNLTENPSAGRKVSIRDWIKPASLVLFVTMVCPLTGTTILSGKTAAEKMLTGMVQPLFVAIVLVMIAGAVLCRRNEARIGTMLILGAILLWLLSMPILGHVLFTYWESQITSVELNEEPLDYVIVLGGGTSVAPDGRAQFGDAGDRVGYAARLYLTGKARNLVTTGDVLVITGTLAGRLESKHDPSEQTRQIWADLGIPKTAVWELPGQNTFSEMKALKERPEWWQDKRCAILTSAFHMPRAMKLAEAAGVKVLPMAADYRASPGPITINAFMPSAGDLRRVQIILVEWLGMQLRR